MKARYYFLFLIAVAIALTPLIAVGSRCEAVAPLMLWDATPVCFLVFFTAIFLMAIGYRVGRLDGKEVAQRTQQM